MNYYPFHLGDYAAHTAHLEPLEDLAYRRMLDAYYLRESALPPEPQEVARIIRMRSNVAEVEAVLREFFTLEADGWRHSRCDAEIERMQALQQRQRDKANKRWHSDGKAAAKPQECHGIADAVPPTPTPTPTPKEPASTTTESPPTDIARAESADSGDGLTPDEGDGATVAAFLASIRAEPPDPGGDQVQTAYGLMAVELRRRSVRCTSAHPELVALVDDGYTVPEVLESLAIAVMQSSAPKPMNVGYLASVCRTQRELAKRPKRAEPAWWSSEKATLAKGSELGLQPRSGEDWQAFRERIRERMKAAV